MNCFCSIEATAGAASERIRAERTMGSVASGGSVANGGGWRSGRNVRSTRQAGHLELLDGTHGVQERRLLLRLSYQNRYVHLHKAQAEHMQHTHTHTHTLPSVPAHSPQ